MKFDYIVFTDASRIEQTKNIGHTSYGVLIVNTKTSEFTTLGGYLGDKSVTYGELTGIWKGLQLVRSIVERRQGDGANILVVTDSSSAASGLNKHIHTWMREGWKKRGKYTKRKIKHHELYQRIYFQYFMSEDYDVRIMHMKAHMKDGEVHELQKYFEKNKIVLDAITTSAFMQLNRLVDKTARGIANKNRYTGRWKTITSKGKVK